MMGVAAWLCGAFGLGPGLDRLGVDRGRQVVGNLKGADDLIV